MGNPENSARRSPLRGAAFDREPRLPRRVARVAGLLALCALAVPAHAAKVRGRVTQFELLENPVWAEAREPTRHGYSFREPVPTVPAKYRKPFPHIPKELCLAAISTTAQKPPRPILIRVGGGRTTPVTIVVPPGTQLTFQNTDPFSHRLYGVGIKTFPPNDTSKGSTRDWTVPAAGVFEIRDELAPSLRMWVVAEANVAAIAYPSMKGEFALGVDEPGEYQIQAFFAGKKVGKPMPVTVEARDVVIKESIVVADKNKKKAE